MQYTDILIVQYLFSMLSVLSFIFPLTSAGPQLVFLSLILFLCRGNPGSRLCSAATQIFVEFLRMVGTITTMMDGWIFKSSPGFHASHLVARPTEEELCLDYSTLLLLNKNVYWYR
jgi:hypothetical protein